MELSKPLRRLLDQFPLPDGVEITEVIDELFQERGLELAMIGIAAQVPAFGEISASAVGMAHGATITRAFFELQERLAVIRAERAVAETPESRWPLARLNGEPAGTIAPSELFPVAAPGATWIYSRSNGVAAHSTRTLAARAAAHELIERDRILRSWYGQFAPRRLIAAPLGPLEPLRGAYELDAYDFGQGVVGVFGLPKEPGRHLLMGTAGDAEPGFALEHAIREALQRLAFLWQTPVAASVPEINAHVDFHLDYFLCPQKLPLIRDWLEGRRLGESGRGSDAPAFTSTLLDEVHCAEITPPELKGRLVVVKAVSPARLPLTFGVGNPGANTLAHGASSDLDFWVHPIA